MALKAIRCGAEPASEADVLPLLDGTDIYVKNIDGVQHTYLDGEDVNAYIRTPRVSKGASDIGVIPAVRIKLASLQQKIAASNDVVMDGRDIGSYIMPDTPYKFYITASPEERAKRRLKELHTKGECLDMPFEDMLEEIIARDRMDSTREFAPLTRTPDAILVDTTALDIQGTIDAVLVHLKDVR